MINYFNEIKTILKINKNNPYATTKGITMYIIQFTYKYITK